MPFIAMRVAIVHYHLEPGGVTSVIAAASPALDIPHVILTGEHVPLLAYRQGPLSQRSGGGEHLALLADLRAKASSALGSPPDVWHFHNPTLGKNDLFPALIAAMAEAGEKLVLHIHDLAEDGRPENYQNVPPLYPICPRIHYAFINERDRRHFIQAGLPGASATLIHNPVPLRSGMAAPFRQEDTPPLLFAPIRGIRRKNLGEVVLLASLLPRGARIAISRAPQNPEWLGIHDAWKNFAAGHQFPISFDVVSEDHPFEQWMDRATHLVTTSIAEGFGLPFWESLTWLRPLIGRELFPENIGHLYQKILVPREWLDLDALRTALTRSLSHTWKSYGRELSAHTLQRACRHLIHGDFLDFGNLPESFQKTIILHPDRDQLRVQDGTTTRPLKPWLEESLRDTSPLPELPEKFTPQAHAAQLRQIYQQVHTADFQPIIYLARENILGAYLTAENFHFLRANLPPLQAIIFDLYGTLLLAPPGAVKHDPAADEIICKILRHHGHTLAESPTLLLHEAVQRHHAASTADFPEIDLRVLWREVLHLPQDADVDTLISQIEDAWHPAQLMPGAAEMLSTLSGSSIPLGILSNAQHHSLAALNNHASAFSPDLTFLSYQHGFAKPSPMLFQKLRYALAARGIAPEHVLFIGNDPLQDIQPAAAMGFQTALFTGHPDSLRPGECQPDRIFTDWKLAHSFDFSHRIIHIPILQLFPCPRGFP